MVESTSSIAAKVVSGTYTLREQRRGRSTIWTILSEIKNEEGRIIPEHLYCRKCTNVVRYNPRCASNLHRHICCKKMKKIISLKKVSFQHFNDMTRIIANWVTEDNIPHSAVEGNGFKKLVTFILKIGADYGSDVDLKDLLPDTLAVSTRVQKASSEKTGEEGELVSSEEASTSMWTENINDSDRNITMNEESLDEICSEDFDSQRSSHIVDLIDVEEVKYSDILNQSPNPSPQDADPLSKSSTVTASLSRPQVDLNLDMDQRAIKRRRYSSDSLTAKGSKIVEKQKKILISEPPKLSYRYSDMFLFWESIIREFPAEALVEIKCEVTTLLYTIYKKYKN